MDQSSFACFHSSQPGADVLTLELPKTQVLSFV